VKKTRQNKKLEPRSDSIGTEMALGCAFDRAGDADDGSLTILALAAESKKSVMALGCGALPP
jgi:hypothetical protein